MDFSLRAANATDSEALAYLHIEGWKAAYGGIIDQDFLDTLSVAERTADWQRWFADGTVQAVIAEDAEGKPAGFAGYGKLRTPLPGMSPIRPLYSGEIYALYILPAYWRQGLGTRLMTEAARNLRAQKHKSLCLWVLEKNKNAVEFYKKNKGERCGKKDVQIGRTTARDICFGWRDTNSCFPDHDKQ